MKAFGVSTILTILVTWKVLVIAIALLATLILPLTETFTLPVPFRSEVGYFFWTWGNFDGTHYLSIADTGYSNFQHGFFPLYSWVIRFLSDITSLRLLYASLIISHGFLFLAFFCIARLLKLDRLEKVAPFFFFVLILYPTSFYYGAVYNDSLFLALACISLLLGRKRRWIGAGIVGGLAALTRMNGLAIFIFLFAEYILGNEDIEKQWKKNILLLKLRALRAASLIKNSAWGIFIVPLGLILYLLYTQLVYGNWRLVFTDQSLWFRDKVTFPLQVFWRYLRIFVTVPTTTIEFWRAAWEFGFMLLYIFLMIYGWRKVRLSYWIFFVASILIPVSTGTFQGMPRYGLHIYPMFVILTLWLAGRKRIVRVSYIVVSVALLFLFIVLFTRGIFVA